jgi:hypothetical protein
MESTSKNMVESLWCKVCSEHERQKQGTKNFSRVWLDGSINHRSSNITDHARSEQRIKASDLHRYENAKSSKEPVMSYAPVFKDLHQTKEVGLHKMMRKLYSCYVLANENMAFCKYPVLAQVKKRHGVDSGTAYISKAQAKEFIGYIAKKPASTF